LFVIFIASKEQWALTTCLPPMVVHNMLAQLTAHAARGCACMH